jgi:hypothetical protein
VVRECCEARSSDLSMSLDASCSTPDFQAIGGRVGKSSSAVAIFWSGFDDVDELALQECPVAVERSWGRRVMDMASRLLWHS